MVTLSWLQLGLLSAACIGLGAFISALALFLWVYAWNGDDDRDDE